MSDEQQLPMPADECRVTPECLDAYASVHYLPSIFGNALFLGIFGAVMIAQVYMGIRKKTWGYLGAMVGGTTLEIVGYYGRIAMNTDPFDGNNFIIYLVGLTIGPAFYSAAIYLSISRIITIFGSSLCWFKPRTVTLTFIGFDIVSLLLQSAGGAIASMADTQKDNDMGVNIMIAGLAAQVAATSAFAGVCLQLMIAIRRHPERLDHQYAQFRKTLKFKLFLSAVGITVFCILVRCIFRCAELLGGFDSELANNETLFMILDGSLMIITALVLTLFHPGYTLGEYWHTATFSLRSKKRTPAQEKMFPSSENNSSTELASTAYERLPVGQAPSTEYGRQSPMPSPSLAPKYEPYRNQDV